MNTKSLQMKTALRVVMLVLIIGFFGVMNIIAQESAPTGAINGLFSVSASQQVYFSQGNLQYKASTNTWKFAENQWDMIGSENSNISENYVGWIYLFGWGTSGWNSGNTYYHPWDSNTSDGSLTENGEVVSTQASYSFLVTGDRTLTANFLEEDGIITFADQNVKNICVSNWDTNGDGELSYSEAAAVTNLNLAFQYHEEITSFDELQYFLSLSYLNESEFNGCYYLGSIVIPNSVTSIGGGTFWNCYALTSIEIPASVTSIGAYVFGYCYHLQQIVVDANNSVYDSRGNCNAIIETETNTLVAGCQNTIIPNTVTSVGYAAFWGCSGLTSIEIPNSVTTISSYAFYYSGLTSMEIPNSVISIGDFAFSECYNLLSIEIPVSVTTIGDFAFAFCNSLSSITIHHETPPDLGLFVFDGDNMSIPVYVPCGYDGAYSEIGWGGFNNFIGICPPGTVVLEVNPTEGGTASGGGSYEGGATCTVTATSNDGYFFINWTENGEVVSTQASYSFLVTGDRTLTANFIEDGIITFADQNVKNICVSNWDTNGDGELSYSEAFSVTSLDGVFQAHEEITSFDELQYFVSLSYLNEDEFDGCYNFGSIVIPNSVTSIGDWAFWDCYALTSIEIPASVTSIGAKVFGNCHNLQQIVVDANNSVYDSRGNCNAIIETETNTLVAGCQNTVIPNTVTSVGYAAFYGCNGLTSIEIPNSVTTILSYAFSHTSLTSIEIPDSVTTILQYAFYDTGLTSIEIQSSVEYIDKMAFGYCYSLSSIMVQRETPPDLGFRVFVGVDESIPVYVPCGYDGVYSELGWGGFNNFVGMCPGEIVVEANPVEGGTVNGGSSFEGGATCTVTAMPNDGYFFANWTENGILVSTQASYSFLVTGDRTLTANFCEEGIIIFVDQNVKNICVSNWDTNGDGELSYSEAAAVTNLNLAFLYHEVITSFDELQYFVNLSFIDGFEFAYCTNLSSIVIPNSVTSIGEGVFYHCHNLQQIVVDANNSVYDSRGNCNAIIETETNTLVAGCQNTVIPNTVTSIWYRAFSGCSGLTFIEIPSSVEFIGDYAFSECYNLSSIMVQRENPPGLDDDAFHYVDVSIPIYVPCGYEEAYSEIGWGGFSNFIGMCPQTLSLSSGWNYVSIYVDIALNDLRAALVEALPGTVITIKQQNGTTNYDPARHRWTGNITWDLSQMYEIKITASCEITLEGARISPSEHTVTIKSGNNWMAFPFDTSMSVTNAFAGFAVNGDMIKSKDGTTTYTRGRWVGTSLTTLEPGKGYIYKSAVANDRTFTFPTGQSKATPNK